MIPNSESIGLTEIPESWTHLVVAGVNSNPRYLGAVPWWFRYWRRVNHSTQFKIKPVCLAVNVKPDDIPRSEWQSTVFINVPDEVPSALAAQLVRLFWPGTLKGWQGQIMTTDIDMLPLSSRMSRDMTTSPSNSMVVYRDILADQSQVPICYVSGSTESWASVMRIDSDLITHLSRVAVQAKHYSDIRGGAGWFTDQQLLFQNLKEWEYEGGSVIRYTDEATRHRRLDRSLPVPFLAVLAPLARVRAYSDFHIPLPAEKHSRLLRWQESWIN